MLVWKHLRRDGPVVLLDVRTDAEVARGMIAGAKHIPLNQLPARYAELDPQAVTVVYCQSGARSAQACMWLGEQGFAQVLQPAGRCVCVGSRTVCRLPPPG